MKRPQPRRTRSINWSDVRERLARAASAQAALSPEQARTILDERARKLAQPPDQEVQARDVLEVVRFALAEEQYAVESRHVREVVRYVEPTPLPGAPQHLRGVINLRGEILALFDLRPLLGLAQPAATAHARILVLGIANADFGVVADEVYEVAAMRSDALRDMPDAGCNLGRGCVRGVTPEALVVIDGAALLRDERFFIGSDRPIDA